ncbi:MAG: ethanolamine utilization microcompartment protein EutL [Oscillospiraceae bacterium]|nr:ethanolamine utilization microcompartment protein EutL [Oscillospiraceae bacterium]
MKGERLPAKVLSARIIPNASAELCKALKLKKHYSSLALLSADSDDVTYIALDEATKAASVEVVYGKSLYAGAANASTSLAGEVIGILGGSTPGEVKSGLEAALAHIQTVSFRSANDRNDVMYLAHCIARSGSYLSGVAKVPIGYPLAYLIAPPVEAVVGLDAALKAAAVEPAVFFLPPTETNFGGALLTGTLSACKAACEAFAEAVCDLASNPKGEWYGIG